ncbi:MAG: crossover junction endodeoxyribonuclease RuvC [Candidatus Eremiobacteraeota bacterium]|nr:crossover junction endodeoxyribonuclease RuvC [Candidatus Eremiobacteraeota bacterium]
MRILGVDPGLRVTGYGVIDVETPRARLVEAGVIEPDSRAPLEARLAELHASMVEIVQTLRPSCMVVEELWTAYRNPSTAVLMGHARGVLCLAAGANDVPVRSLAHALVKCALVGSGAARKEQVKRMVAQLLGLRTLPRPDDVSDALALAIAFAHRDRRPNGARR